MLAASPALGAAGPQAGALTHQPSPRQPARIVGVTVDDVSHLTRTIASLRRLPSTPWTRLVLNVNHAKPASVGPYARATRRLAAVSHVMAELVDSSELRRITKGQIVRRTSAYLAALHHQVGLWEIGNEVNGNWTGSPRSVARKVSATYRVVHQSGARAALTLYENRGCGDGPKELGPTAWSRAHLSAGVRRGLNQVLLSYYEPQCHNLRPSDQVWTMRFRALHRLFPNATLGFGEIGMPRPATPSTERLARSIVHHYYSMRLALPYFVRGDFYWYYVEDMTPWRTSPLWRVLSRTISSAQQP
jgi:hypothetical protein